MKYAIIFSGLFILLSTGNKTEAQVKVSGIVYDSTQFFVVPDVLVFTTSGQISKTDSLGAYSINTNRGDSIYFYYDGKNSLKYAISQIPDPSSFDISMKTKAVTKYKVLKEVTVFGKNYRQDSLENRIRYSKIFDNAGRSFQMGVSPEGVAGVDIGSLIQLFQFRKNKQNKAFQQRLIENEQDAFVDYKFNSRLITRITGLTGSQLEEYKKIYRPTYEFAASSNEVDFYQYILNTSYAFKKRFELQ